MFGAVDRMVFLAALTVTFHYFVDIMGEKQLKKRRAASLGAFVDHKLPYNMFNVECASRWMHPTTKRSDKQQHYRSTSLSISTPGIAEAVLAWVAWKRYP